MSIHNRGIKPQLAEDREALAKAPPAPAYLSTHAKAEWRRIMPQLIGRRIITAADLGGLAHYCTAAGICRQLAEQQAAADQIDSKLFGVWNRAAQTARQLAAEFGLSPTSRQRIGAVALDYDADDDPLAV